MSLIYPPLLLGACLGIQAPQGRNQQQQRSIITSQFYSGYQILGWDQNNLFPWEDSAGSSETVILNSAIWTMHSAVRPDPGICLWCINYYFTLLNATTSHSHDEEKKNNLQSIPVPDRYQLLGGDIMADCSLSNQEVNNYQFYTEKRR